MKNKDLSHDLVNYEGTNSVLVAQNAKLEEEKKALLLEVERLERDKAELLEVNRTLMNAVNQQSNDAPKATPAPSDGMVPAIFTALPAVIPE